MNDSDMSFMKARVTALEIWVTVAVVEFVAILLIAKNYQWLT